MSLFDRGHVKSLCNQSNSNRARNNNRRQQQTGNNSVRSNNQRQHASGKSAKERKTRDLADKVSDIVRRFESDDTGNTSPCSNNYETNSSPVNEAKEVLSSFASAFNKNLDKPEECRNLIEENIGDICAALKYYYDPKFEDALPEMNKVMDIMSTNQFTVTLLGILKRNPFGEEWDEMWKDVAFAISLLLDFCADKMKEETVQIYVTDILSSNGMWKTEIRQLVDELGITEDLAIDLIIGLPVKPDDMTDLIMRCLYRSFLNSILNHAEDNIEVLDRNTQRKLFDFFFDDRRGKLACKVIGRFLSDQDVPHMYKISRGRDMSTYETLVYGEFKTMLMERLECYDVNNITFVLKFIVDQKKRNKFDGTMFSAEEAAKYDTIRKAIMKVVSQDSSAKPYLV